jgi:uncharacterized RDD family membrane protein YckC
MRRPDNEPLLFDLPLDRPARDGDAEPVLDGQPPRAPRPQQPAKPPQISPARSRAPQAAGAAGAAAAAGTTASGRAATAGSSSPAPRLPLATAAAISPRLAPPAPSAPGTAPDQAEQAEREAQTDRAARAAGGTVDAAASPIPRERVGIGRRAAAGAADLLVHVAVAVLALGGCRVLGIMPAVADWPAFGVFLLSFSFLYTVVPLAFWGHTLGMTWAGLTAESTSGEPLSFDQTARRWLGALLTLAAAGLPLLLALSGRSLADRLSGSRTLAD